MKAGDLVTSPDSTMMTVKSVDGDNAICNWFVGDKLNEELFLITDLALSTPEEVKGKELEVFEQALKDRAKELSTANGGKKVVPVWYLDPLDPENGKPIIGFLMEPNFDTKGGIMDKFNFSESQAKKIALAASIMEKDGNGNTLSDPRITSTNFHYDAVRMAAGTEALGMIKIAVSQFKKK